MQSWIKYYIFLREKRLLLITSLKGKRRLPVEKHTCSEEKGQRGGFHVEELEKAV